MTNNHHRICPHCGSNLVLETPMKAGEFSFINGIFSFRDEPVKLKPQAHQIIRILMQAGGHILSNDAILIRLKSDAFSSQVSVQKSYIKKALAKIGAPDPIEAVYRKGLRWIGPTVIYDKG